MYRAVDELVSSRREISARDGDEPDPDDSGVIAHDGELDLRTAALILAIQRVATVTLERGIWP